MKKLLPLLLVLLMVSCNTLKKAGNSAFTEDFYKQSVNGKKELVYIEFAEDTINVYSTDGKTVTNTTPKQQFLPEVEANRNDKSVFIKNTPDLDFVTMPLKYRPGQSGVKPQLNASLNGAVYFGYRTDKYITSYNSTPLKRSLLDISHYGFSVGLFTGIGNTTMNATTTNNKIIEEYDGIVWSKGVAGIVALNKFTAGVALGFDTLLDGNDSKWIYQNRPWVGLALGLNLN